jgi:SAM-dependent methyltransferase
MTTIHPAAADGFNKQADAYTRGRPEYPQAALDWLTAALQLGPDRHVIDLGAGTGKFTRLLAATGARVTAVEPVEAMRAELAKTLPDVTVLAGTAEAIPLPDASLDAVVCAQAFHWFATPAAVAEIRRVLKPGGELVMVWNVRDESVDWVAALTDIMTPHEGDAPRFYKGDWRRVFPADGMGALSEQVFPYVHTGPAEHVVVDRVRSVSFIAALPDAAQAEVIAAVRRLIDTTPALVGKQEVSFPYRTVVYRCSKLG